MPAVLLDELITLFFPFPIATMSGRWPASIPSQAYPRKTTASLSSTNSKSLFLLSEFHCRAFLERYSVLLQWPLCKSVCFIPLFPAALPISVCRVTKKLPYESCLCWNVTSRKKKTFELHKFACCFSFSPQTADYLWISLKSARVGLKRIPAEGRQQNYDICPSVILYSSWSFSSASTLGWGTDKLWSTWKQCCWLILSSYKLLWVWNVLLGPADPQYRRLSAEIHLKAAGWWTGPRLIILWDPTRMVQDEAIGFLLSLKFLCLLPTWEET